MGDRAIKQKAALHGGRRRRRRRRHSDNAYAHTARYMYAFVRTRACCVRGSFRFSFHVFPPPPRENEQKKDGGALVFFHPCVVFGSAPLDYPGLSLAWNAEQQFYLSRVAFAFL